LEFGRIGGTIGAEGRREGGAMKIKGALESILAGVISAILSYRALRVPAELAAFALRRKMPDAWFSGLIVWYALFVVIGISIANRRSCVPDGL
jgi:hypothetical protein